jgi:hypothetical protein
VLLRQVELELLLKTRASAGVVLTQGLELGPVLGELLRDVALRRNGAGPTSGQLVLRAGRRLMGNLTPLVCIVEAVELRKDDFAVAVVLGACGLRLQVCACICSSAAGRRRGLCCCRLICAVMMGGPRASGLAGREGGASSRWLDPGGRCPASRPVKWGRQRCPGRQRTWRSFCTRPRVW